MINHNVTEGHKDDEVSTGSGSDRALTQATNEVDCRARTSKATSLDLISSCFLIALRVLVVEIL